MVGLLVAWRMLGGSPWTLAFEPIATSKIAMGPGAGDIMTPLEIAMRHHGIAAGPTCAIPAAVVLACMAYFWFGTSLVNRLLPRPSAIEAMLCAAMLLAMAIATSRLHPQAAQTADAFAERRPEQSL